MLVGPTPDRYAYMLNHLCPDSLQHILLIKFSQPSSPCVPRSFISQHLMSSPQFFLGLYSLSGKTSYRKISWSLEAVRFGIKLFQSLWNLAGTSAALLPRCLSNFRAIRPLQHPISRLRDFTRFGGKTSYRLVNRGPEVVNSRILSPWWRNCRWFESDSIVQNE